MSYSRMWKDFHCITINVIQLVFLFNAIFQFSTMVPRIESLLVVIIAMLIEAQKQEWYKSPDPEPEERDESDGWFS